MKKYKLCWITKMGSINTMLFDTQEQAQGMAQSVIASGFVPTIISEDVKKK